MKYFLDTEFYEDGTIIDLISIGIVAEDGREFYAVSREAELHNVSDWLRQNVLPQLPSYGDKAWMCRADIRSSLYSFVSHKNPDGELQVDVTPEFWGYYADYDWICVCQLFGTMMNLPRYFPKFCRDLKQLSVECGSPAHPKQESGLHNALEDARWNKRLYEFLAPQQKTLFENLTETQKRCTELLEENRKLKAKTKNVHWSELPF